MMRFSRVGVAASVLALLIGGAAIPASANVVSPSLVLEQENVSAEAVAATYAYKAGHPMYFGSAGSGSYCTGSYTITGTSGAFILTAGHCASAGASVYGSNEEFGTIAHRKYGGTNGDTALVQYYSNVIPYQIVVNPHDGTSPGPGGQGRITGVMPTSAQELGIRVGKMGNRTGHTEGEIIGTYQWYGLTAIVADFYSNKGDSGGPVWRWDGYGLRALGVYVGFLTNSTTNAYIGGVYIPMRTVLNQWGASMPVFASATARNTGGQEDRVLIPPGSPSEVSAGLTDVCAKVECEFVEG